MQRLDKLWKLGRKGKLREVFLSRQASGQNKESSFWTGNWVTISRAGSENTNLSGTHLVSVWSSSCRKMPARGELKLGNSETWRRGAKIRLVDEFSSREPWLVLNIGKPSLKPHTNLRHDAVPSNTWPAISRAKLLARLTYALFLPDKGRVVWADQKAQRC